MTILDRYILKSFFFNLFLWFFCIVGIFIVFDLFTNLDGLLKVGKEVGNIPKVVGLYYLFKSVPIGMMLSSLLGLISAMITVAMLMRHNELIPIQAAGVSTLRIVTPLIVAVVLVAAAATVLREAVLPNYLDELVMDVTDFTQEKGNMVNAIIDRETGITIMGDRTFRSDTRISAPNFVIPKPIVKQVAYLKAKNAFHRRAEPGRPAGFLLDGMKDPPEFIKGPSLQYEGKTLVITHRDAPDWVEEGNCFVVSNVPFDYLASSDAWRQYASTWDLMRAARNKSLDVGNRIHAVIHARLLQPFLDITLLFLGLPIILCAGDRNVFKAMGISGLIVVAFLVVRESCQYFGANGEMPVLGAWLPMMVFTPIAVNQFLMLREK